MASSSSRAGDGVDFSGLNEEQLRGYQLAVEERQSVFITGEAGTGKSTLVRFIIDGLKELDLCVALTAHTGIAAHNIGGITLCKWIGFGTFSEPLAVYLKRKMPVKTWKKTDVLIIDEISVVSAEMFDKIDALARKYRRDQRPFGGLQLIVMGDFFQLAPVIRRGQSAK